jgi:cell division transport system ATP-binding protein
MATHNAEVVDAMRRRVIELDGGLLVRDQQRGVYGSGASVGIGNSAGAVSVSGSIGAGA